MTSVPGTRFDDGRALSCRVGRGLLLTIIALRWTYVMGDRRQRRKDRRQFLAFGIVFSIAMAAVMVRTDLLVYGTLFLVAQFALLEALERPGDRAYDARRAARRQAYRDARIEAGFLAPADDPRD
ncbi:MAG: hypothetical protein J7513_07115 [Solirubrobacteraceae bacterium]|nr:hypothetical protein [Solirubrobacteraceae bacterium]